MKHRLLDIISNRQINKNLVNFRVGDEIKISFKENKNDSKKDSNKKQIAKDFNGLVINFRGEGVNKTFTVRKEFKKIGIERTFSLYSPLIKKIEVISHKKVRRSKLYYVRKKNKK